MALLHHNVPGVLATLNQVLADSGANIVGQSLSTRGEYGYVITHTDLAPSHPTLALLRDSAEAIWLKSWSAV